MPGASLISTADDRRDAVHVMPTRTALGEVSPFCWFRRFRPQFTSGAPGVLSTCSIRSRPCFCQSVFSH